MKSKIFSGLLLLFLGLGLNAQVPQGFNYQAVARDVSGNIIPATALDVQVAILSATDPDVVVWEEQHSVTTTDYGMINLMVGDPSATRVSGLAANFEDIDWSVSPLYLRTEIYYQSAWKDLGNARIVSVPYALMADEASGLKGNTLQTEGLTFSIVGGDVNNPDALFEVRRSDGEVVFGVYNEGVEINVPYNLPTKAPKGGFAIGGFDATKKGPTEEYFRVTRDSSRVYVNQNASNKGPKGGFAIGGFDGTKAEPVDFLNLTYKNYFIGQEAGNSITTGLHNAFFGYQAGYSLESGDNNVFLGHQTGFSTTNGHENVFIGNRAGYTASGYDNIFIGNAAGEQTSGTTHSTLIGNEAGWNISGDDNILIGDRAGHNSYVADPEVMQTVVLGIDAGRNFSGSDNTILGYGAGSKWGAGATGNRNTFVGAGAGGGGTSKLGSDNVCLGYDAGYNVAGDNKLYIGNNTSTLINGDFSTGELQFNTALGVGINTSPSTSATLHVYDSETAANDAPAIIGEHSLNTNGYGIGVRGSGGYIGVQGYALVSGTGARFGVYGYASGGNTNYGIYGYAGGGTTNYAGYFSGDINVTGSVLKSSDRKLKKNIMPLSNALERVLSLQGVSYDWKTEEELKQSKGMPEFEVRDNIMLYHFSEGKKIGLIAQELEAVFPELVYSDSYGMKSIDYTELIPVLIEAMKEQQEIIMKKDEQVDEMYKRVRYLEDRLNQIESLLSMITANQQ